MNTITFKNGVVMKRFCYFIIPILIWSNVIYSQTKKFEIINRTALPSGGKALIGVSQKKVTTALVNLHKDHSSYKVQLNSTTFAIDKLSCVEYADRADRIIVFGDSLGKDIEANVYAKLYSGRGSLIKAMGRIVSSPYVSTFNENGNFIIVGNKSVPGKKHVMALICYDANGNRKWERRVPDLIPVNVFSSADSKNIAVVMYNPELINTSIYYYNGSGQLLFTDNSFSGVSGIEFLSSGKVVITTGNYWYLYNFVGGYKLLSNGVLQGNVIGKYPVSSHPSKDIFFIVSVDNTPSKIGIRIQAFSGRDGSEIAEKTFEGQPFYSTNRLVNVSQDDKIALITSSELIELLLR